MEKVPEEAQADAGPAFQTSPAFQTNPAMPPAAAEAAAAASSDDAVGELGFHLEPWADGMIRSLVTASVSKLSNCFSDRYRPERPAGAGGGGQDTGGVQGLQEVET